ncbi:MAG TPA: lipocalin family protein [Chitinophagaceae bacterium]|nr:lipocalin family protein [Chitinophagaceae bacterium]
MLKRLVTYAGLFALVAMLNINCSKDDDEPPTAKTKTELITTGSWKFDKIDPALAESFITCFKDNTTTFTADGKGTCPDSGEQCNPPTGNFNWNFTDNESKLHLDATLIPTGSGDFTIVTLNETNLVLSQNITSPAPATITITLKH